MAFPFYTQPKKTKAQIVAKRAKVLAQAKYNAGVKSKKVVLDQTKKKFIFIK